MLLAILLTCIGVYALAGDKPEITHHTVQYLDRALSINVQWQAENPVTHVKVFAGRGEKDVVIDEYDNRRNPSGYQGEVSVVIPVEQSLFQGSIPYQIQLEDDLRQKSTLFSGQTTPPAGGGAAVAVGAMGMPPGMPGAIGIAVPGGMPGGQAGVAHEDGWGKDNIRVGKGSGEKDGKSNDMVDKMLAVAERFDTPPSLDAIKVDVLGPENVAFSSKANDDKGIKQITFRVYDGVGNKVGEQVLNNLGRKWEGSTQPIKVTDAGNYRVIAQAVDSANNTSKEQAATFVMKGTPPPTTLVVTLLPQEAIAAGGQWQIDGGAWQASASSIPTTAGKHRIAFKDATGWMVPVIQDIEIKEGPNTATANYTVPTPKNGKLIVSLVPANAVKEGAQWQADGGAWQNDGTPLTLAIGKHRVSFKDVAGWIIPVAQEIDVIEGDNKATATYTVLPPKTGVLNVTLLPADAAKAGAQWQVDGGAWQSEAPLTLTVGTHKITFKDVTGWVSPIAQEIAIKEGDNKATGTYMAKTGTLSVTIIPAAAAAAGGQWRVGSGTWQNSGASQDVPAGAVSIEFKDVGSWIKPVAVSATVEPAKQATANGTYGRIYTLNKDFEEGTLVGLENQTVKEQLQLSKTSTTLPFIWIPNSDEGSISKINTETGIELGRFRVGPANVYLDPSRTTVDLMGNCWVGNRQGGTAVKVGLSENGQCVDKNGNGKIETANGGTALAWGEDECVLFEVSVTTGTTYQPGKNQGDYSNASYPRGVAIDANNNVWVSTFNSQKLFKIDGATGKVTDTVSLAGHTSYGLVVDKQGKVWSSGFYDNHVLRYNPLDRTIIKIPTRHMVYGIGIDKSNHLFAAGLSWNRVSRINTVTEQMEIDGISVAKSPRSIAVTNDGDVWVTNYGYGSVTRLSSDLQVKAVMQNSGELTGVAVDSNGKVWAVDYYNRLIRIDPGTNAAEKEVSIRGNHYSYSDMTGFVARTMTTQIGTWTVTLDAKADAAKWQKLSWNASAPQNTSLKVRARSTNDQKNWSAWEDATKDIDLKSTPAGRYVQVESTLQVISGDTSPILSDLTVFAKP